MCIQPIIAVVRIPLGICSFDADSKISLFSAYNIGHEGDIALTERDWNVYEKTRFRRNAVRQRKKIWPNRVIPYEIEEGLGTFYFHL